MRLDDVVNSDDLTSRTLLKVDVQGAEMDVFIGCGMLLNSIRWIWVEVSFVELYGSQPLIADVVNYLASRGYGLADLGRPTRAGGSPLQIDLLFEK